MSLCSKDLRLLELEGNLEICVGFAFGVVFFPLGHTVQLVVS